MIRRSVTSSNVSSVGWEASSSDPQEGTLEVEFRSGHIYQYDNVPESLFEELLGASSVGRFLNASIIGEFDERRVR